MSTGQHCQRCGRGIHPFRIDTGFCSGKCAVQQEKEDKASAQMERDDVEAAERVPTPSEIDSALAGAIDEEEIWVEKFEFNEWNDSDAPEAAAQSRRTVEVLKWLRAHHAKVGTAVLVSVPQRNER